MHSVTALAPIVYSWTVLISRILLWFLKSWENSKMAVTFTKPLSQVGAQVLARQASPTLATPGTAARRDPLSVGPPGKKLEWAARPSSRGLLDPGFKPPSALAGWFLATEPPGKSSLLVPSSETSVPWGAWLVFSCSTAGTALCWLFPTPLQTLSPRASAGRSFSPGMQRRASPPLPHLDTALLHLHLYSQLPFKVQRCNVGAAAELSFPDSNVFKTA